MQTSSAKDKGRKLENFVVQLIRDKGLDKRANRNPGSGSGKQKGDVWNSLGWSIECKNTKRCPGKDVFEQVARESMGYTKEAIVWHRPNTSLDESHVLINIHDFLDLLKSEKKPVSVEKPSHQLRYKLETLKRITQEIIREIK